MVSPRCSVLVRRFPLNLLRGSVRRFFGRRLHSGAFRTILSKCLNPPKAFWLLCLVAWTAVWRPFFCREEDSLSKGPI